MPDKNGDTLLDFAMAYPYSPGNFTGFKHGEIQTTMRQ